MPKQKLIPKLILSLLPIHRILISLVIAIIVMLCIKNWDSKLLIILSGWLSFAAVYLIMCWIVLFNRPVDQIPAIASKEDGNKYFVSIMILISSFAGMVTLLVLMLSDDSNLKLFLPISITAMILSWGMVHTVFTFHYAHLYYDLNNEGKPAKGLQFPEEQKPDYIDFAYFSFVIGCTFQVSDVEISSRKIRRLVLLHGLISFALNTFVVALTINIIAGLKQ